MRHLAVQILDRVAPRFAAELRCRRYRRELSSVFQDLVAAHGKTVLWGPFRGMNYAIPELGEEQIYHYTGVPKLLGCYERELHPVVQQAAANGYHTILNIGCAEGYYAAGLARLLPAARVYAFDIDAAARELCGQMAAANGVQSRVTILGECPPGEFDRLASGRTLVVCDCEGAELQVLQPDLSGALRRCDVVVELHPHVDASIPKEIPRRFTSTHSTALIPEVPRDPADFPVLAGFNDYQRHLAVSEFREGAGQWAFFSAKAAKAALPYS